MTTGSVLILGALSDIGIAIAHKFACKGHDIKLAARNLSKLKTKYENLNSKYNINVNFYEFDVLKTDTHINFIENLDELPSILICAIGNMGNQNENETKLDLRIKVLRTNNEGPINIISEFANIFEKRGSGTIVGISSVAGERGRSSNYIYGSAKAGFTVFLSGLRNRLAKKKVHVLTVLPGTVYTKMTSNLKLPKLFTTYPDKVSDDIYMAVKKKKNIIYSMGVWRYIVFIIKLIPEEIFKKLKI